MKNTKKMVMALLAGLMMALPGKAQQGASEDKVAFGLRTNLVTWTLGAPGVGVDVSFASYWQLGLDAAYSCCVTERETNEVRVQTLGLQARRYFRPFGKMHIGYDVNRKDGKEYVSDSRGYFVGLEVRRSHYGDQFFTSDDGTHGDVWSGSVIGGYSYTLSRWGERGHWGIDALLGFGFIHKDYARYEWYEPAQMFRKTNTAIKNKFGLTTLEVSLNYRF